MSQLTIRIKETLERHDKWIERLYWKAILFETILLVTGYATVSYLILARVDITNVLVLTLAFPAGLVFYRARRSITLGKVLYVSFGAALGAFLGSLIFFAALAVDVNVSFGTLMVAYTLSLPGAWLGHKWGKKRGFLMPGSSKMGKH